MHTLKFIKYSLLFVLGGVGYGCMEVAYRKKTHWSMLLAGGICFCAINKISEIPIRKPWKRWLLGSAAVTAVEFVSGLIVNEWLCLNVWDYSNRPFNYRGQVCPLFSCLWFLLCIPAMGLCKAMRKFKRRALRSLRLLRSGLCRGGLRRA